MKKWTWVLVLLLLFSSGCSVARLSLKHAEFEVGEEFSVLELTLGNKGVPIHLVFSETMIRDGFGNEYKALEHTGNLGEAFGDGYLDSVSGTIVFPRVDPNTKTVQVKITT